MEQLLCTLLKLSLFVAVVINGAFGSLQGVWKESFYNGNMQICDMEGLNLEGTYSGEGYITGRYTDDAKTTAKGEWNEYYKIDSTGNFTFTLNEDGDEFNGEFEDGNGQKAHWDGLLIESSDVSLSISPLCR